MASPQRKSCLPIVERGCCCDLKTCCKWQGWLCLIGAVLSVGSSINSLIQVAVECNELEMKEEVKKCSDEDTAWAINLHTGLKVASIVLHIVAVIIAALFLHGISQNNPRKLLPFIYVGMIEIVFGIVCVVLMSLATPAALVGLIAFALPIYCLICANSLHVHMTEAKPNQPYNFVHPNAMLQPHTFVQPKAVA